MWSGIYLKRKHSQNKLNRGSVSCSQWIAERHASVQLIIRLFLGWTMIPSKSGRATGTAYLV